MVHSLVGELQKLFGHLTISEKQVQQWEDAT